MDTLVNFEISEVIRVNQNSELLLDFFIDFPQPNQTLSLNPESSIIKQTYQLQKILFKGWVLGKEHPPLAIEITDTDGQVIKTMSVNKYRPDVAQAYPEAPQAQFSGFEEKLEITNIIPYAKIKLQAVFGKQEFLNYYDLPNNLAGSDRQLIGIIEIQKKTPATRDQPTEFEIFKIILLHQTAELLLNFCLDFPKEQTRINGNKILFQGWILGEKAPSLTIEISTLDCQIIQTLPVNKPRPDVAQAYPEAPQAQFSGFSEEVEIPPIATNIDLQLQAVFEDNSQENPSLKHNQRIPISIIQLQRITPKQIVNPPKRINVVRIEQFSELLLDFYLDFPNNQSKIGSNTIIFQGWVLGKKAPPLAIEITTLDGKIITTMSINKPRPDVAQVYPEAPQAQLSGFAEEVEITAILPQTEIQIQVLFENSKPIPITIINFFGFT